MSGQGIQAFFCRVAGVSLPERVLSGGQMLSSPELAMNRPVYFFSYLYLLILLTAGPPAQARAVAPVQDSVLLFSYFKGNGEDGLHLAYSRDGYRFEALNGDSSVLRPEAGKDRLMRDPCIVRGGDGNFHMVWTVSWNEQGIGYARSPDLVHWSPQQYLPVMEHEAEARNCWAPEITFDPRTGKYLIYWSTTIPGRFPETDGEGDDAYNHRIYCTTTSDFKTFSPTRLLYDPGFNVIDASIQSYDGGYVMFLKNETRHPAEKNIRLAFSKELEGPYGPAGKPITGDYWAEGPTAIRETAGWIVYFDKYRERKMGAVVSEDLRQWKDVSGRVRFPEGTRHGTVLRISREELQQLEQALDGRQ